MKLLIFHNINISVSEKTIKNDHNIGATMVYELRSLRTDLISANRNYDDVYTSKLFGFKDANDYYNKTSPECKMHLITVPTLFINSWDDPIMGTSFYDPDLFKKSKSIALATTKYGGHLGYHTSLFNAYLWIIEPSIAFLSFLVENKKEK